MTFGTEEPDQQTKPCSSSSTSTNKCDIGNASNLRRAAPTEKINMIHIPSKGLGHPSIPNTRTRTGSNSQESSQQLDSISLSDRWAFILQDSELDEYNTSFSKLLKEEEEEVRVHVSANEKTPKNASTAKIKHEPTRSIYSVAWSIGLSTLAILGMTSIKSLYSAMYTFPVQNLSLDWKTITQTIPFLLSAEQEIYRKSKKYVVEKFIPLGWQTIEKMVLMEIWRSIWLNTFRTMREYYHLTFGENYYESLWETYAPGWIRRGVRSYCVKIMQGRVQNVVYSWVTRGWKVVGIGFGSWWLDVELVGDGDIDANVDFDFDFDSNIASFEIDDSDATEIDLEPEILDADVSIDLDSFEDESSFDVSLEDDSVLEDNTSSIELDDVDSVEFEG